MVDTWDPHDVFDAPDRYIDMYDRTDPKREIIYPVYGRPEYTTDDELEHVRARCAAKATMVDTWIGSLVDHLERPGLADDVEETTFGALCDGDSDALVYISQQYSRPEDLND